MKFEWTNYMKRKMKKRGFDPEKIENIIRYSSEQYSDVETRRNIVVGRHDNELVLIAYEVSGELITPVTAHGTTRQKIRYQVERGRFLL